MKKGTIIIIVGAFMLLFIWPIAIPIIAIGIILNITEKKKS